jgi:hypothetical protein
MKNLEIKLSLSLALGLALWVQSGAAQSSLHFNGTSSYVDFGAATSTLGATNFTVECWFRRVGTGTAGAGTGTGGVTGTPIVSKGRGESESPSLNCNYYIAYTAAGKLTADFEEVTGPNHPLTGTITITSNVWHHAALTYNGTNLTLYLDGVLDNSIAASGTPDYTSIQHAGVGTSMNSAGVASGFFAGNIFEVRIWNYARSQPQLQAAMSSQILTAPGLLGHWALNDGTGSVVSNSVAGSPNGTISGTPVWTNDVPFVVLPQTVALTNPTNNASLALNSHVALMASATSTGTVSKVEFFANGTKLGESATNPYNLDWVPNVTGAFALTAVVSDNSTMMTTSAVVNVTVVGPPVLLQQSPADLRVFLGSAPTLHMTGFGPAPLTYQWSLNSVVIPGASAPSYTITNTSTLGTNTYTCVLTNNYGSVITAPISVAVISAPTAPYPSQVLSDTPAAYFRLDETGGTTAYDYVGGNNANYTNVMLDQPGYSPSLDRSEVAIELGDVPPNNDFAGQGSAYLNFAAPSGGNGEFSVEAWFNQYFVSGSGNGIVALGYGNGGEQFVLDTGGIGNTLRFFVRNAAGVSSSATSTYAPQNDGLWHHAVGVCDQAAGHVYLYLDGALAATGNITVGSGILAASLPLSIGARESANNSPVSYDFQFIGLIDDVALYSQALSAAQVQTHYFSSGAPPTITQLQPLHQSVNQGENATFTVSAQGIAPLSYHWLDNNQNPIPWGTNASVTLTNVQVSQAGTYSVTVGDPYGTITTNATLTVNSGPPVITVDLQPTNLVCYAGTTNTLSISVSGTAPFAYQWLLNGSPIGGASSSSYTFAAMAGTNTYRCHVTNGSGAADSSIATVAAIAIPTVNPANFSSHLRIQFTGYNRPETLTNFPVLVRLSPNLSGFSYSQFASPAGGDLRFADASGTRALAYEIEQWNPAGESAVWVQVPQLAGTNDFIMAYWGNPADTNPMDSNTNGAVWKGPFSAKPEFDLVWHLNQTNFPFLDSTLQFPALTGVAPSSVPGIVGSGIAYNGSTTYLDAGEIDLTNSFTLSLWVNISPTEPNIQTIWASKPGSGTANGFAMNVNNFNTTDGALRFITGNGSSSMAATTSLGAVGSNRWHMVAASVDTTANKARLFVDGNDLTGANTILSSFARTNNVRLGSAIDNFFTFLGSMDEARIEDGTRSTNWIWASYMTVGATTNFESYSSVSSSVVTLNYSVSGQTMLLNWSSGTLQSADDVSGPYSDVTNAASPYPVSLTGPRKFYRVRVQ